MDPHSSAQDVHRCDICETVIVHSYCDFCHVNLCKPCIGEHISDGHHKHVIVPFQERTSTLIYPKCETHPNKTCELQCKDCDICVCSSCMASDQHKGHSFAEVAEIYMMKKVIIEKDAEELKICISPSYEEIALDLENQIANLDVGYEKPTSDISKQGEEWHMEIDLVVNKMKAKICDMKEKHIDILRKQLDEVKQTQSLIKQTLQALHEIEKSTEVYSTIEYISKIRDFSKPPPKVQIYLPKFISKRVNTEKLYSLFGQITPLSTTTEEKSLSLKQPNISGRELLDEPKLAATIQTGYTYLRSVTCLNEDKIWMCEWANNIKCFNNKGTILQTIKTQSGEDTTDIAVNSEGDLLYSALQTRTVNKLKNGQTEELIRLHEWVPNQLCVTPTGDLLVTMYSHDNTQSKVVRYSGSSKKQTIQFDGEGEPLYSGNSIIKYITENRNHDICVADNKAGAVVVVNQNGKLRWRYTGHPSTTKNIPFRPWGITTDSQSRILTADNDNHCIHILDQNGQFLRYIDNCDLKDPYGISADNNDNLFVCEFYSGNVKKVKYLT